MQKIITTFLCCIFLSLSLFAQQSIQIERGYTKGTNTPGKSFSLSWFTSEGLLSGGALRLTYMNTSEEIDFYSVDFRVDLFQVDVTKRWHSNLDKRTTGFIETGLSGMALNSDRSYDNFGCCLTLCDCLLPITTLPAGGVTERGEAGGLVYNYKNKEYQLSFLPGATLGAGVDVRLGKRFYAGLNCRTNVYFELENKDFLYYLTTGLSAGWRF